MPKFGALDNRIIGSHTDHEWWELVRMWKWRCFYCRIPICKNSLDPQTEATKDHQLPISRGGVDYIWNIVPACLRCNQLKGEMTVDEFKLARPGAQRVPVKKKSTLSQLEPMARDASGKGEAGSSETVQGVQEILPPSIEAPKTNPSTTTGIPELLPAWREYCGKLKAMDDGFPKQHDPHWYAQRRTQLRTQALRINRIRLENLGQLVLPIFGDGAAKKLAEADAASMVFRGLDVEEA